MTFIPLLDPPDHSPDDGDAPLWFCVRRNDVLVRVDSGAHELPAAHAVDELPVEVLGAHFLGVLDGRQCWAADLDPHADAGDDGVFEPLFTLHGRVPDPVWTIAGRAVQIVEWDRTHRYCGRCGTETEPAPGERARRCPACGLLAFPRLAPAVIVLVERDGKALLAQGRSFGMTMYSTLAGFVEPGETLEQAVAREVYEEVSIEIGDIRYFGSQPWPFPHSLMVGFTARWTGGEIEIDEREIVDANWFDADELPPIPGRLSIARRLIDNWLAHTG